MPISADLKRRFEMLLDEVYRQGIADGNAQTLQAIMKAASMAPAVPPSRMVQDNQTASASISTRAPRGRVKEVVTHILGEYPGLTATEIGELAPTIDEQVSSRSVGGELRRHEGRYYWKEGKRWFLVQPDPSNESGGTTGADTPAAGDAEEYI